MQPALTDYSVYRTVVSQLMSDTERLPSLPTITFDIRRALENPNVAMTSLSKLITKDPSLTALLLKHASNSASTKPENLLDVIRQLGLQQIERITMAHSVRSLFTINSVQHKRLYVESWNRVALKSAISRFLAEHLNKITPDHALLGSLLSEIGSLAVLSAFKTSKETPDRTTYIALCREYSKSLGLIMLKKWQVADEYIDVIRYSGDWQTNHSRTFNLCDLINLSLFHSIRLRKGGNDLPHITSLSAYKKLPPHQNTITQTGELTLIAQHTNDIIKISRELFQS